jgi:hypothetical protein
MGSFTNSFSEATMSFNIGNKIIVTGDYRNGEMGEIRSILHNVYASVYLYDEQSERYFAFADIRLITPLEELL